MRKISELNKEEEQRAFEIHKRSIFINAMEASGLIEWNDRYLSKLKEGGVNAENVCATAPSIHLDFSEAVKRICNWYDLFEKFKDKIMLAASTEDIEIAKRDGKIALILGFQNGEPIEDELRFLKVFQKLGVRIIQLTYQRRNFIGNGCGERKDSGLSNFGVKVVEEMNALGLVIDLSHVGIATTLDTMEISKDPVIFSHSNSRSISDTVRNLTDEQIQILAEKEGVIGISNCPPHVRMPPPRATIEEYLDHIDYITKLVGVDHVGIGLDNDESFWGGVGVEEAKKHFLEAKQLFPEIWGTSTLDTWTTEGLYPSEWINITKGLVARGYSDQEIEKILGRNFLRVFKKVWKC